MLSLNDYQLGFLRSMIAAGARFVIIGGQARRFYDGSETRDLDLWADIGPDSRAALERVLLEWSAKHPAHLAWRLMPPLHLRRNVQIKFPDIDGCLYLDDEGKTVEIGPDDGIDILTSLQGNDFATVYDRANIAVLYEAELRILCLADIAAIAARIRD